MSLLCFFIVFSVGVGVGQLDFVRELVGDDTRKKQEQGLSDHKLEKLAHEQTRKLLTIAENQRDQFKSERDEARKQSKILELFGEGFWLYRSSDVRKEVGSRIDVGTCGQGPCYRIVFAGIDNSGESATVMFRLWGLGGFGPIPPSPKPHASAPIKFHVPLKKGCRVKASANKTELMFAIEDDAYSSIRVGVSIKATDNVMEPTALSLREVECP